MWHLYRIFFSLHFYKVLFFLGGGRREISEAEMNLELKAWNRTQDRNHTFWHHQVFSVALKEETADQMFVKIAISANTTHRLFIYLSVE